MRETKSVKYPAKLPCKRCFEIDESQIRESINELLNLMPEEKKASPEIYSARLQTCLSCESLIKGSCIKCGCYVELRAAKNHMECPAKNW